MIAGTRLTNTIYVETAERIAAHIVSTGFTVRETAVLLSTSYAYTLSFVTEEQAVFPKPGGAITTIQHRETERSP